MTLRNFIQRLNWRQILVHFVATWFFIYAFQFLAYLSNTTMFDGLQKFSSSDQEELNNFLKDKDFTAGQMITYFYYASAVWLLGLIIAFIFSLLISKKRKWFWINSLIVFLLVFFLKEYDLLGWSFLKSIFLTPGKIFKNSPYYVTLYLLTDGLILLGLGIFTFLNRRINEFIDNGNWTAQNHYVQQKYLQ